MSDANGASAGAGTFPDRLGEFVLLAFATGQRVEGEWYLFNAHRMVPDINVTVTRLDAERSGPAEGGTVAATDARPFEVKLESFLLREYADGESIVGTWKLEYARGALPTWSVDVDLGKVSVDANPDEFTVPPSSRR